MHFDHAGIATDDAEALAELYADLFGLEIAHEEEFDGMRVVFVDCGNGYFELLEPIEEGRFRGISRIRVPAFTTWRLRRTTSERPSSAPVSTMSPSSTRSHERVRGATPSRSCTLATPAVSCSSSSNTETDCCRGVPVIASDRSLVPNDGGRCDTVCDD